MALPTSYLTSMKNLSGILNSIVGAQAPERFTTRFLESLGYANAADRLMIGVLKSLGFLADDGRPTQRYFDYLDQTRASTVMAQAIREAYADLFKVNKAANKLSKTEVTNKIKTLTQGQYSESVLDKMAATFGALCSHADFEAAAPSIDVGEGVPQLILWILRRRYFNRQAVKDCQLVGWSTTLSWFCPSRVIRKFTTLFLNHLEGISHEF